MVSKKKACTVLSRSVVSDSLQPYGLLLSRLFCPWRFSRQEYWSGLPCTAPEDLLNSEITRKSLMFPALAGVFFTTSATWEACVPGWDLIQVKGN